MENSSEDEWPFVFPQGTKIGEGRVSLVNELGPDWVIKEVNPINERGEQRSKEAIEAMKSPERVKILNKEQVILEKIFGKDHFAKHRF